MRAVKIGLLLAMWYSSSIITSLTTKTILSHFPFPITLALVQQAVAAVLSYISWRWERGADPPAASRDRASIVTPIAGVMVLSLVSYRWSMLSVSVSFTHTIKTLGPMFTIFFSRLLLSERMSLTRLLSVLPVVLGVAITTSTEVEFALVGFCCAMSSTVCQALQSVLSKQALADGRVSKPELFCVAALYALLLLLPLFALLEAWRLPSVSSEAWRHTGHFLMVNGLASFANQYTGLSVLHAMASPLSHALANVMKRAAVISMAFVYAQRPVTPLHLFGVALSVFGTLLYQQLDSWYPSTEAGYELVPLSEKNAAADQGSSSKPVRREGGAVLVWPGEEGRT